MNESTASAEGRDALGEPPARPFTLVELVAVIAVIAILAALLFPTLTRARRSAHDTACRSNLKQMGIALAAYTADSRAYPFYIAPYPATAVLLWHMALEPYSGARWGPDLFRGQADAQSRLYLCPAYARLRPLWDPPERPYAGWDQLGCCAYNARGVTDGRTCLGLGGTWDEGTSEGEVLKPGAMVAIADAPLGANQDGALGGGTEFSYQLGFYDFELESQQIASPGLRQGLSAVGKASMASAIAMRHGGRWNTLFCDGHVQPHKTKELFDWRDDAVLSLRNKDNLPHRELQSDPP